MKAYSVTRVHEMSVETFFEYAHLIQELSPQRNVARHLVEHILACPEYALLLAKDDVGHVIGTVRLMMKIQNDCVECEIDDMVVTAAWRGKGVGQALMEKAHQIGLEEYAPSRFTLTSNPSRTKARELYLSLGYTPVSETTWFELPASEVPR